MESLVYKKTLENDAPGNKFESILKWTKENRDKLFGERNNLIYDVKEDMDFMFIVDQDVKVNIKGYFRFDDCNECEILRKGLAYKRGQKDQFKGRYTPFIVENEGNRVIKDKPKVQRKELLELGQELAGIRYHFNEEIGEGLDLMLENKEFGSTCYGVEVKLMKESPFFDEDLRKGGPSVLVEEMNNNFIKINKDSSMVQSLRNRVLKMEVCAYDLNQKANNLGQFVNNEEIIRQKTEIFKFNEDELKGRLDTFHCEKKGSVKLLVWLKSSEDYVTRDGELVNQKAYRQGVVSIKRQVYFCQDFGKPLEQRTPRNAKILPRGLLSQERTQGSENVYRGKSVFKHQEKGWPNMTGCLDQEVTVQVIKQVGLSSVGNNDKGDNFQVGVT